MQYVFQANLSDRAETPIRQGRGAAWSVSEKLTLIETYDEHLPKLLKKGVSKEEKAMVYGAILTKYNTVIKEKKLTQRTMNQFKDRWSILKYYLRPN